MATIWFCLEQILGAVIIGGSLIKESVPSCVYILVAMVYMLKSVGQDKASVVLKLVLAIVIAALSLLVIGGKIALSVLMYQWSRDNDGKPVPSPDRQTFYKSFGIMFSFINQADEEAAIHGIETFGPDLLACIGGAMLLWYAVSHLKEI